MAFVTPIWLLFLMVQIVAANVQNLQGHEIKSENGVKSSVFLSPKFVLGPGSVANKIYYNIDFPRGHIAIKSFDTEVVDEAGNPVPLHQTYLHHWVVARYYQRKGVEVSKHNDGLGFQQSNFIFVRNSGICNNGLIQYFGLGSENRGTDTHVPDPYGIDVGNPEEVPDGYEERWLLNVHAIDTRDVEDRFGCTECRCDLFNVTTDNGQPLPPDYIGGLKCCHDMMQCRLRKDFKSSKRGLYMKYMVKWVDWDNSILPVKIYIFDITDKWKRLDESKGNGTSHDCQIEYDIEYCRSSETSDGCIDTKRVGLAIPNGGDVVYAVAHQHKGGFGASLYGEDGRVICSSKPSYGKGDEVGNEAGYIVGMSTCYPRPGSVRVFDGEMLTLESNYSSVERHTGVMGLFYILVAHPLPGTAPRLHAPVHGHDKQSMMTSMWGLLIFGIAIVVAAFVAYRRRSRGNDGYHSVLL